MNPYVIGILVVALVLVVWAIAAERYYKMGYQHAIDDVKLVGDFIKTKIKDNSDES
jgi:hypothetical protein